MSDDFGAQLQRMLLDLDQHREVIEAAYQTIDKSRLRQVLLLEYRCATKSRCLLMHVWQSPGGVLFHSPPHKKSSARNLAQSNESGRRNNTIDGDRRWKGYSGVLDQLRGWPDSAGMPMHCDHVDTFVKASELFMDVDRATPGHPTRRQLHGVTPMRTTPVG